MIALLDPQRESSELAPLTLVHTLEFLRETSHVLLAGILTVSTKFFRRDAYHALLSHTQMIVNRAMGSGACSTGLVQCILLLIYWKTPTDRTTWTKLGHAIRLAFQMRWHMLRQNPLPSNEREARLVLVSSERLAELMSGCGTDMV